jgi:hypothetical protein
LHAWLYQIGSGDDVLTGALDHCAVASGIGLNSGVPGYRASHKVISGSQVRLVRAVLEESWFDIDV